MIEIKDFCKSYSGVSVFENFNLSVKEGEITCILGESGSGKTTLLNAVAGLISYGGQIPKLRCSYVFQTPRLVPNLTVRGNLSLVCTDGEKTDNMLKAVGLYEKGDMYPINLSGGEAQRVSVARAFLFESDILLMDEPFSSLDLKLKKHMLGLFFDLWDKSGKTVLYVTHDVDEAAYVAQRVIVISSGKIKEDFVPSQKVPREFSKGGKLREKLVNLLIK